MAKKKKSGPPYDYSKSENAYLLVVWCYGMDNDRPSERTQIDVDRAGTFIEAATGYLPNRIFTRKTVSTVMRNCNLLCA
ncbi:hypothetical protein PUNSTDRAFT_121627 [Punctularia strigosozonata HHB-11173 SS5]|uniref:uncharacterized protein n=1 Tax=Punctularia strigosozonata (strain HHB-11173) TaxID=741275 RepID=UPI0004417237|nr:uncharacterized protein PUNSTDRAFT_121627 [Punctularia strigosozonata HHB-11173 SS5]EIN06395.1 hypothetical protein PUNSTDRAFT_121627 [Punctularia strigosozonata HHB-11173 SS5]